jgi:hypothetical protein
MSKRRKPMAVYENYIYNIHSERNGIKRWRCTNRKCCGVIYTNSDDQILDEIPHNHDSNAALANKILILRGIDERILNKFENRTGILSTEFQRQMIKSCWNFTLFIFTRQGYKNSKRKFSSLQN